MSLKSDAATYAHTYGVPVDMFDRFVDVESHYDPNARGAHGEIGICQIIPKYHPGVNARDPQDSMRYAASTLRTYKDTLGDWHKSFAAWNSGLSAVALGKVPDSTKLYVEKIVGNYTASPLTVSQTTQPVVIHHDHDQSLTMGLCGVVLGIVMMIALKLHK